MVLQAKVGRFIDQINEQYEHLQTSAAEYVKAILAIGDLIVTADEYYEGDEIGKLEFLEALPFNASTASKYRAVAKNRLLKNRRNLKRLPPSVHALYELNQLDDENLGRAIDSDISDMSVRAAREITASIKQPKPGVGGPRKVQQRKFEELITISVASDIETDDVNDLLKRIGRIVDGHSKAKKRYSRKIIEQKISDLEMLALEQYKQLIPSVQSKNTEQYRLSNLVDSAVY